MRCDERRPNSGCTCRKGGQWRSDRCGAEFKARTILKQSCALCRYLKSDHFVAASKPRVVGRQLCTGIQMHLLNILIPALLAMQSVGSVLPENARRTIDRAYPSWSIRTGIIEYEPPYATSNSEFPAAPCQRCFLNQDTIPDFALHIMIGEDSAAVEHFIVLLSEGQSYSVAELRTLPSTAGQFGTFYFVIYKAGYEFGDAPFAEQGDPRRAFPTDCVGIMMHDKNYCDIFLFDKGKFKSFSPCE